MPPTVGPPKRPDTVFAMPMPGANPNAVLIAVAAGLAMALSNGPKPVGPLVVPDDQDVSDGLL
jgi:hypothetical protein